MGQIRLRWGFCLAKVRQITFKKENDSFIEGFGDLFTTDNKTVFRKIDSLNYNSSFKLIEIDCGK
jgi:hypothetical protein